MTRPSIDCPFCRPDQDRVIEETALTRTIRDGFPVSPGHTLITTIRHVTGFFELTEDERAALTSGLWRARDLILQEHTPDGFNVGVNIGEAAGQTVPHVHVHLIPRYSGDVPNPRGGVRAVIPDKAGY